METRWAQTERPMTPARRSSRIWSVTRFCHGALYGAKVYLDSLVRQAALNFSGRTTEPRVTSLCFFHIYRASRVENKSPIIFLSVLELTGDKLRKILKCFNVRPIIFLTFKLVNFSLRLSTEHRERTNTQSILVFYTSHRILEDLAMS